VVFLDSSVLVTVPSGDWVTVFSFDLTVPSLLTLLLSVLETVRSHPTTRNDNAKADVAARKTTLQFFILLLHSPFSILLTCLVCLSFLMGNGIHHRFSQSPLARPVPWVQHTRQGQPIQIEIVAVNSSQPTCQQWLEADFRSRPSQRTWHPCRSIEGDPAVAFLAECTTNQPRSVHSAKWTRGLDWLREIIRPITFGPLPAQIAKRGCCQQGGSGFSETPTFSWITGLRYATTAPARQTLTVRHRYHSLRTEVKSVAVGWCLDAAVGSDAKS
jgi:hypothetical protein